MSCSDDLQPNSLSYRQQNVNNPGINGGSGGGYGDNSGLVSNNGICVSVGCNTTNSRRKSSE